MHGQYSVSLQNERKCLSGEQKPLVTNLETMNAIWTHLDDRYGDILDLVEIVMKELKALQSVKHNDDD